MLIIIIRAGPNVSIMRQKVAVHSSPFGAMKIQKGRVEKRGQALLRLRVFYFWVKIWDPENVHAI